MKEVAPGRRRFLRRAAYALGAGTWLHLHPATFAFLSRRALAGAPLQLKPIPGTNEYLPAIGLGTYITFNVGPDEALRDRLTEVLRIFFDMGGGMIDSSPMYGTSEGVLGDLLGHVDDTGGRTDGLFAATKVWTRSTATGEDQIDRSLALWNLPRFDLMQVHNLVNWRAHLETIRARRAAGEIRYTGVTTSHGRRHDELERVMRDEPIDFVQLTYNLLDREAEDRLLPLARDRGIAVIANRPFRRGRLFDRFADAPLPDWAGDFAITNWAQFFLKFIISHDAITCAIPATSRPAHMRENMGAMRGPLPDADTRRAMIDYIGKLQNDRTRT